jgi:hypothetical protein
LASTARDGTEVVVASRLLASLLLTLSAIACTTQRGDESKSPKGDETTSGGSRVAAPSSATEEVSKVHTDVEELRQSIHLPAGVTHARWIVRRKGDGVLGPGDYSMTAYVELSPAGWTQLACDGGAPGEPHSQLIDADLARALLPANTVVSLSLLQGQFRVPTVPMPSACVPSASTLHIGSVDRIGDGLWIHAFTM